MTLLLKRTDCTSRTPFATHLGEAGYDIRIIQGRGRRNLPVLRAGVFNTQHLVAIPNEKLVRSMVLPMVALVVIFGVRIAWLRLRYDVPPVVPEPTA